MREPDDDWTGNAGPDWGDQLARDEPAYRDPLRAGPRSAADLPSDAARPRDELAVRRARRHGFAYPDDGNWAGGAGVPDPRATTAPAVASGRAHVPSADVDERRRGARRTGERRDDRFDGLDGSVGGPQARRQWRDADRYTDDQYAGDRYPRERYPAERYPEERYADGGGRAAERGRYAGPGRLDDADRYAAPRRFVEAGEIEPEVAEDDERYEAEWYDYGDPADDEGDRYDLGRWDDSRWADGRWSTNRYAERARPGTPAGWRPTREVPDPFEISDRRRAGDVAAPRTGAELSAGGLDPDALALYRPPARPRDRPTPGPDERAPRHHVGPTPATPPDIGVRRVAPDVDSNRRAPLGHETLAPGAAPGIVPHRGTTGVPPRGTTGDVAVGRASVPGLPGGGRDVPEGWEPDPIWPRRAARDDAARVRTDDGPPRVDPPDDELASRRDAWTTLPDQPEAVARSPWTVPPGAPDAPAVVTGDASDRPRVVGTEPLVPAPRGVSGRRPIAGPTPAAAPPAVPRVISSHTPVAAARIKARTDESLPRPRVAPSAPQPRAKPVRSDAPAVDVPVRPASGPVAVRPAGATSVVPVGPAPVAHGTATASRVAPPEHAGQDGPPGMDTAPGPGRDPRDGAAERARWFDPLDPGAQLPDRLLPAALLPTVVPDGETTAAPPVDAEPGWARVTPVPDRTTGTAAGQRPGGSPPNRGDTRPTGPTGTGAGLPGTRPPGTGPTGGGLPGTGAPDVAVLDGVAVSDRVAIQPADPDPGADPLQDGVAVNEGADEGDPPADGGTAVEEAAPSPLPEAERIVADVRWRLDIATLREVVDDRVTLLEVARRLEVPLSAAVDNSSRARMLCLRAQVLRLLGELDRALADSRLAMAHAQAADDHLAVALARTELAQVLRLRSEHPAADRMFLEVVEADVPDAVRSLAHENAGRGCVDQGRYLEACDHFGRAVRLGHPEDLDLVARMELALDAIYIRVLKQGWGPAPRRRTEIMSAGRLPVVVPG